MPSLAESLGALATYTFVPANVISSQAATQAQLNANAERLNSDAPGVLQRATQTGNLTDGQAKASLQDMNRSLFAVTQSDYNLGNAVIDDTLASAAAAPSTLINYTNQQVLKPAAGAIADTTQKLIPWQLWVIVGLAVAIAVGIFSYVKSKSPV